MHKFYELVELCVREGPRHLKYIYRPHPAENVMAITSSLGHLDITISQDTSLVNDLLNSRLVIHNFCTVGVEAKILGIPTLGYSPISYNIPDEELVYKDAAFASSASDALSHIFRLTSSSFQDEFPTLKSIHINSTEKSYKKIANCIDKLSYFEHSIKISPSLVTFFKKRCSLLLLNTRNNYHSHRVKLLTVKNIISRLEFFKVPITYKISSSIFSGLITLRPS